MQDRSLWFHRLHFTMMFNAVIVLTFFQLMAYFLCRVKERLQKRVVVNFLTRVKRCWIDWRTKRLWCYIHIIEWTILFAHSWTAKGLQFCFVFFFNVYVFHYYLCTLYLWYGMVGFEFGFRFLLKRNWVFTLRLTETW